MMELILGILIGILLTVILAIPLVIVVGMILEEPDPRERGFSKSTNEGIIRKRVFKNRSK